MIYFISDTHFGHKNIIDICNRPFQNIEEMDSTLIENWNKTINSDDIVYIVGDFAGDNVDADYYLKKLNGKKILLIGNHDKNWIKKLYKRNNWNIYNDPEYKLLVKYNYFYDVKFYLEKLMFDQIVTLCHYPMVDFAFSSKLFKEKFGLLIHGHIHNNIKDEFKFLFRTFNTLNCGVEVNNYTPVNIENLIKNNLNYKLKVITDPVDKAYLLASFYHQNQFDKAGKPYFEHPKFVASLVDSSDEKIVAYLHDILEDTDIDINILKENFSEEVVNAIKTMTHNENDSYFEYIEKISQNKLAKSVKISDLTHNSDLNRLKNVTEKDLLRLEKYKKAIEILKNS
ncbi:MAG: metallophosphoesterase [Clostridia bacterium]|nr:metallophosphoesterase [Clostridia bacterium]